MNFDIKLQRGPEKVSQQADSTQPPAAARDISAYLLKQGFESSELESRTRAYCDGILQQADAALIHATWLSDLDRRFPEPLARSISIESRAKLDEMKDRHRTELMLSIENLDRKLKPIWGYSEISIATASDPFEAVQRLQILTGTIFSQSGEQTASPALREELLGLVLAIPGFTWR